MHLLAADFPGINGFLGTRGSLMLDIVFVGMLAIVPVLLVSIWIARRKRDFQLHKMLQLGTALTLLVVVLAFELEVRVSGWAERAQPSPHWRDGRWNDWIDYSLAVHLCFAIPTPLVWALVIVRAQKNFDKPPRPHRHSAAHRLWGRIAAGLMVLTAITGWVFYWLAFAAT